MTSLLPRLLLLGALAGFAQSARAQVTYTPAAITPGSFTADVVADGNFPAARTTTHAFDQGSATQASFCLMSTSYVSPVAGPTTRGLPANGLLRNPASTTTPNLTFQLRPYLDPNSLRIAGTGTGSLTLTTPQAAQSVWVVAATGNGDPSSSNPVTMTVTFTDNTTQVFQRDVPDWFGGTNFILNNLGRVNRSTDVLDLPANEPRLYQFELALLPANYAKLVANVQFAKTQPAGVATPVVLNAMAVTLASSCSLPNANTQAVPSTVCLGQATQLVNVFAGGSGGLTYQWQASTNGGTTWTDIAGATNTAYMATPTATTQYRVRITCSTGTTTTSTPALVTVLVPSATLTYNATAYCRTGTSGAPTVSPAGGTFGAPSGLSLNPATGELNLATSTAGTYTVTYTSPGQCPANATASVTVKSDELPVFPNVLTPNGDGQNDLLRLRFLYAADLTGFQLQVFNRWGRKVYEGRNATEGWNPIDSSAGTYYYMVDYTDCAGRAQHFKTWLEVVK